MRKLTDIELMNRLNNELSELTLKCTKLNYAIGWFTSKGEKDQAEELREQLSVMQNLAAVLSKRINNLAFSNL